MSLKIKIANFFARQSCLKWQRNKIIRGISRKVYRLIMETGAKDYPYADPSFAKWPESDGEGEYTLISDSAGFVIRRSPSFIAWKMKQATGHWPKCPTPGARLPGEHAFDAKHWDEILEYNGWERIVHASSMLRCCVGIIPDEGEFGQLVWCGSLKTGYTPRNMTYISTNGWDVTTYKDFEQVHYRLPFDSDVVWFALAPVFKIMVVS